MGKHSALGYFLELITLALLMLVVLICVALLERVLKGSWPPRLLYRIIVLVAPLPLRVVEVSCWYRWFSKIQPNAIK